MSSISAHHQNGVAENAIKIVVTKARTMMLHAALRWPNMTEKALWPLALSHAAYIYNRTPSQQTGVAPIKVWSRTKLDHHALRSLHPWGCPVYVLDPKLRDDGKLPKWEPRSRRGQYMGASPFHASTVGLVRNLQTGSITPQYHVVYDDFFETVHSGASEEPTEWPDLVVFNRFRNEFDEDSEPELGDDWLTPEELSDRRQKELERTRSTAGEPHDPSEKSTTRQQREPSNDVGLPPSGSDATSSGSNPMPEPAPRPNPGPASAPPAVSERPSLPPTVRKHEPSSGNTNTRPV